jgi:MazG family protein
MPSSSIHRLVEIMAALRHPDDGCPWDLEQTYDTIVPYTLEEAYEVAETIEHGDRTALKSELGDLLFQVVFYARLAEEDGLFSFDDVVEAICEKMVRRHPHVFGEQKVSSSTDIAGQWDRIKAEEAATSEPEGQAKDTPSVLNNVPATLPALSRAIKLQNKAARVGFDWPSLAPVFDKMREELEELKTEIDDGADRDRIEDEFGDVLFVVANVGRHLKIDPEQALRRANNKFISRFQSIERDLQDMGKSPEQSDLEEMEALWQKAKQREKDK